jgi:sulfite reductase alpha subunit-like flavoprotein
MFFMHLRQAVRNLLQRTLVVLLLRFTPSCVLFLAEESHFFTQRLGLDVPVLAMDEFDMPMLPSLSRVVFFVSTTGQGGAPDNMKKSWSILLRKELPSNSLSATHVAVFGLGDSSYTKFNFPSKKLHARLQQLGAQPMLPLGLGDDQHVAGPYTALVPWQALLIKILAAAADAAGVPTQTRQLSVVANYSVLPVAPPGTAGNIVTCHCSLHKMTVTLVQYRRQQLLANTWTRLRSQISMRVGCPWRQLSRTMC